MHKILKVSIVVLLVFILTRTFPVTGEDYTVEKLAPVSIERLSIQARARVSATARTELAPLTSEAFATFDTLEPAASRRIPNYLRALSPSSRVSPFARLIKTVLYSGSIRPEIKMAMGLRTAQLNGSPYVAAHLQRFLGGNEYGSKLLKQIQAERLQNLEPAERHAVRYAELLTADIHGVSDEEFRTTRGFYNDGQVVELTLTVAFFNYFTRMAEALNLPVESWVLETRYTPSNEPHIPPVERVNLISDAQLQWAIGAGARGSNRGGQPQTINMANSQRAMNLRPEIAAAWQAVFSSNGDRTIDRELRLQVSFAVSESNGCRYCTLHQVQGLRREGVPIEKLMKMKKEDAALTPRELTAVKFARQLTRRPFAMTDTHYKTLKTEFGPQGAIELLLQTCNFAFMNRFTDGLRLPSEDEAVRTYLEVYGKSFERSPSRF